MPRSHAQLPIDLIDGKGAPKIARRVDHPKRPNNFGRLWAYLLSVLRDRPVASQSARKARSFVSFAERRACRSPAAESRATRFTQRAVALFDVHQPALDGLDHRFRAVGHIELAENIGEMNFYRAFDHAELGSDFLIAEAAARQLQDFDFPR
jgi:hypothetical protein